MDHFGGAPAPFDGVAGVELRHLRAFMAVADEGGFTHAAARLRIGQPTLTRTVRSLEETLGARLFDRTTRRVELTPEGRRLRDDLAGLLPRLDEALRAPCAGSLLRLGFTWTLPDGWARVSRAFESETGARVRLVRRDAPLAGLDAGDCDVAVLRGEASENVPGLATSTLLHERRVAAVATGSPLSARRVLDWTELADWPLVVNTLTGTTRLDLWPEARRPQVRCTADNVDEWVEAIAAGHGVGVAPESVRRYSHPGVRYVRLKNAPAVPLVIAIPASGAHPLAARFAATARRLTAPHLSGPRRAAPGPTAPNPTGRTPARPRGAAS
ncbi:LysR family transcriptional regulator [Actinomadura xylanilytica]|uniref:LysR family transcriptional regulator n=1 Tax=Actinomadura xylanilytica TaxID=887459 RepID=UPI00255B3B93|nr:LysR family transcriptional regulator [Actinomadura xylanilytica]MDL4772229.1 LysR family transcriptional regulator [Actinomadura xylanilytica]